ncbi:hypothetical protein ACP70R_012643 [Stipagrostis hirtigluma subsp. patula]
MAPRDQGPHGGAPGSGGAALIVSATGYIGLFVADACLASGRKTCVLVRPGNPRPSRAAAVDALRHKGAVVVEGRLDAVEAMLRAHGVEVVISVMGGASILDQLRLVDAVRAAGTVKRATAVSAVGVRARRGPRAASGRGARVLRGEAACAAGGGGVGRAVHLHGYIYCNSTAGWPYFDNMHPSEVPPPLDRFQIYGDGNVRAFFVAGNDIRKFTVMAAYDPRSANKIVHFRPACNLLSTNEMASLWESKIGRTLPRVTLSEDDLLAMAAENIIPASIVASLTHDIFINGCQTSFPLDGCRDIEISSLYPDIPLRTVDECFDDYARSLHLEGEAEENKNSNALAVERLAVPPTCA